MYLLTTASCTERTIHQRQMDSPIVYTIIVAGCFGILLAIQLIQRSKPLRAILSRYIAKYLTYPYLVDRHRLLGPWTRGEVILFVSYVSGNLVCIFYPDMSAHGMSSRSGSLSLINMIYLFSPNLDFLAHCLGITLHNCRRLHCVVGYTAGSLMVFHVVCNVVNGFALQPHERGNVAALIVGYPLHT